MHFIDSIDDLNTPEHIGAEVAFPSTTPDQLASSDRPRRAPSNHGKGMTVPVELPLVHDTIPL